MTIFYEEIFINLYKMCLYFGIFILFHIFLHILLRKRPTYIRILIIEWKECVIINLHVAKKKKEIKMRVKLGTNMIN